jgi:hypothetical protein
MLVEAEMTERLSACKPIGPNMRKQKFHLNDKLQSDVTQSARKNHLRGDSRFASTRLQAVLQSRRAEVLELAGLHLVLVQRFQNLQFAVDQKD